MTVELSRDNAPSQALLFLSLHTLGLHSTMSLTESSFVLRVIERRTRSETTAALFVFEIAATGTLLISTNLSHVFYDFLSKWLPIKSRGETAFQEAPTFTRYSILANRGGFTRITIPATTAGVNGLLDKAPVAVRPYFVDSPRLGTQP